MTDITMIALSKLVEGKSNARRTDRSRSIGELAASIEAHGLLQSLVVADCGNGRYSVEAGGRRLKALRKLAKRKSIAANVPIPCRIVAAEAAAEASLAENVVRTNMHAVDEIEAFAKLTEAGEGPEAIGARFGVSGTHVARRLKLARVSPKLIDAFRKNELDFDQLSALAFSDDHAAQEAAFFNAPEWARTPERLRAQLAQAHVPETDKLARFVGVETYEAAGGAVVRDLFDDQDHACWLADRSLLVSLAEAKLTPIVEEVRGEGWAFVEIAIDGVTWTQFPERVRERRRELTADEATEQERLYALLDETEDDAEIERLEHAIDALAASGWNPEEVAIAGVLITLARDGTPRTERGLVRLGDVKALRSLRRKLAKAEGAERAPSDDDADSGAALDAPRPGISAKLLDELMAHKTLALRAELASQPDLALRVLVFALASDANSDTVSGSLVRIRIEEADVARRITRHESKAPAARAELLDAWRERLPADPIALWAFIASIDHAVLFDLLAVLIAPAIELSAGRDAHIGNHICEAAQLDMSKWWQATPESYFAHVRKDAIIDAIKEAKPTLDRSKLDKLSKAEVLARAKRIFKGAAWLPDLFRQRPPAADNAEAIAAE